ncbi:hypothetical protein D3C72_864060 [compost metagenome]
MTQLGDIDERQTGGDTHQRRQHFRPRQFTVAMAIEQVGEHRNHHRQGADNHGRHGRAGALNGAGQTNVIDQIAHHGQAQGGDPVAATQLTQASAPHPRQRQGEKPQRQIAPHRLQHCRVFRHNEWADKN